MALAALERGCPAWPEGRGDARGLSPAPPDAEGIGVLARLPRDKILGFGVIDHTDRRVETPDDVVRRAEAALELVPRERLSLNTDCGFAPSSVNPMDLDEAYLKLQSLCRGAAPLRERYA